jgi:hypothetical protein
MHKTPRSPPLLMQALARPIEHSAVVFLICLAGQFSLIGRAADPTLNVTNYWGYVRLSLAGILFIGLGLNPKLKNKVSDLRGAWDLAGPEEVHPHL